MEGNIVKKVYPNTSNGKIQFENEIAVYNYLKECNFIPTLLHYSKQERTLYLPYLNVAKKTPENKMFVCKYLKELEKKWGLQRLKKYHWDNVRELNGQIFLIDFGSIPIKHTKKGVSPSWKVIRK